MSNADLTALLNRLRAEPRESEWLEFKVTRLDAQPLGEYLSALANSACLLGKPRGYLVFGIADGSHAVVGTAFDRPVEFDGKAFVRNGSSKTALVKYPEKERAIWSRRVDWSAQVCEQATLADLDPLAIAGARRQYAEKNKTKLDKLAELAAWDDGTFLNKAKLTVHGAVTFSAMQSSTEDIDTEFKSARGGLGQHPVRHHCFRRGRKAHRFGVGGRAIPRAGARVFPITIRADMKYKERP